MASPIIFAAGDRPRVLLLIALGGILLSALPDPASAQYFGRNKVQYDDFEFEVLKTDHFDFHFYQEEADAVMDAARMGERWYERFARTFQHEFEHPKPVILYADHPDFQQTNSLSGFIGEGTGGVTESLKNRVIMPLTASYWDTDHVLGHEMVHAFQYNIAQAGRGRGMQGLMALPLWLVEGMAEYMSVGRDDPFTAMWIRDAIRRDELPTIHQMTTERKYFPYRFGQALWAYIGGTYGDDAVVQVYRRSLQVGFEGAIQQVLGLPTDTLSLRWKETVAGEYLPFMEGRIPPANQGTLLLSPATGSGRQNVSPSVSPDGRHVAFLSEKDLFTVDLFLADTETGEIIRKLSSAEGSPHVDALRYIDSSGTWSPDGEFFAFVVTAGGDSELEIVRTRDGGSERIVSFVAEGIGSITQPAWSPDGRWIAFSGSRGGIGDLFLLDLESGAVQQLTDDRNADFQPAWSPDGSTIAFTSDRGPETDFEQLSYSAFQLAFLDVPTRQVTHIPVFGNVKHINPQFAPDGRTLYFISDQDGVSDIYALGLDGGALQRITNVTTGISGITYSSPAMTVAARTGAMVYSVFDSLEYHVYRVDQPISGPSPVVVDDPRSQPGRRLSPADPGNFSRVATYLADAETGLFSSSAFRAEDAVSYRSSLSLDYVGQPTIGVSTGDYFGSYLGGGAAAFFSDMLGNRSLGVALSAQGTFKDIGGQAFYQNLSNRWNWAVGGGRTPYILDYYTRGVDPQLGYYESILRYRLFVNTAVARLSYPFSTTRRVEFSGGASRYGMDLEENRFYVDAFGRPVAWELIQHDSLEADALNMVEGSLAFVEDNAFFGFVSPIRGGRTRLEFGRTEGDADYNTVVADWRRYFSPTRNLTIGVRGLHYGRYGVEPEEAQAGGFGFLRPLFVGYQTLVRGYAYNSFTQNECGGPNVPGCPVYDRLWGQQLGVASVELRIPLIGVEQYGIINFPYLPTEFVVFTDAGAAWDENNPVAWEWSTTSDARIPVTSSGVSARMNLLGMMIVEIYYAYPWQRPEKGWHWGFQLAPGW